MMDIEEAVAEYLASLKLLGSKTRKGYEQRLGVFCVWIAALNAKKIEQHLKKITLDQMNALLIASFVEHLHQAHSSKKAGVESISTYTSAGYVRCIKAFLNWCLEDEVYSVHLKVSQIKKIKLPHREKFVIEVFSDIHLERLRKHAEREYNDHLRLRDKCILSLLLCTGVRADELCTLKIADVHLLPKEAYIKVHGKGDKWREVPLIEFQPLDERMREPQIDHRARRLLALYKQRYRSQATSGETFFVGRTQQQGLSVSGLEKMIARLGEWAEIEGVRCSPHTFRHTFAARFMQSIGDVYLLSKILGHGSVKTTEEYLKSISGTEVRFALIKRIGS